MVDIKTITSNLPTTAMGKENYGKLRNNYKAYFDIAFLEKAKNKAIEEASKTYLTDPDILEKVVASIQDPNFNLHKKINAFKHQVISKINKELVLASASIIQ